MSKDQFINELRSNLSGLSEEEIEDILYDYKEHFQIGTSKGKTETEISKKLGDPKNIAKMYKASSKINEAENNPSTKNILKAIFSAMALGLFNFIIVLGPFIAVVAIIAIIYFISIGFVLGGVGTFFGTIVTPFLPYKIYLNVNPITSISFGIGLTALGLLLLLLSFYMTKLLYKATVKYLKWNLDFIKNRR